MKKQQDDHNMAERHPDFDPLNDCIFPLKADKEENAQFLCPFCRRKEKP